MCAPPRSARRSHRLSVALSLGLMTSLSQVTSVAVQAQPRPQSFISEGLTESRLGRHANPITGQPVIFDNPVSEILGAASVEGGQTTTTTLFATADAGIAEGQPSATLGRVAGGYDTEGMRVGAEDRANSQPGIVRSLVRFDLTGIPPRATIIRARLSLHLVFWRDSTSHPSHRVTAYRVTDPWTENGVTWNNQPPYAEASGAFSVPSSDNPDVFKHYPDWDVTQLVQSWVDGVHQNHGIMLRGNENLTMRGFGTREGGNSTFAPRLELEYTLDAPTPTWTARPSVTVGPTNTRTPTPTRTSTPSATATASRTHTATVTATPRPPAIYLPLVVARARVASSELTQTATPSSTRELEWIQRAPVSVPRSGMGVAADDLGSIYAVAGSTTSSRPPFDPIYHGTVERYSPADFAWTQLAQLPNPRSLVAVVALGQRVFAIGGITDDRFGGSSSFSTVQEYLVESDTWVERTAMPSSLGGAGAAVGGDGKIYIFGGTRYRFNELDPLRPTRTTLASVFAYDPSRDRWSQRAPMPRAIASPSVASGTDGRIYLIDGASTLAYDPATDRWIERASMPTDRSQVAVTGTASGRIYAVGGFDGDDKALATVEEYDVASNTWRSRGEMPTPRGDFALVASGRSIFAIDGAKSEEGVLP